MAARNKATFERLRHAYGLLGSAELGRWCEWTGPQRGPYLATRVKLLAVLGNALPRAKAEQWEQAVPAWTAAFPPGSVVSFAALREVALRVLRPAAPVQPPGKATAQSRLDLARQVLEQWRNEVLHSPRWTHLASVIPGEAPFALDEIFVELTAIPREDAEKFETDGGAWARQSPRRRPRTDAAISALAMAARTLERCVVLGAPGSGKSTLVQWLARAIAQGKCPDFEAGIVVKLSAYAEALRTRPRLSLLKFFGESLERPIPAAAAMHGLRALAKESRRVLLLLDGWDEVPPAMRDQVLAKIHQEQPCFITLVTSRPAGMPRQLASVARTDFYEIAGLAPQAIQTLVRRLLAARGAAELADSLLQKIEADGDLSDLAQNPFLLGLLVRVLLRGRDAAETPSLAGIYAQVTAWLEEQYEQARGAAPPLRQAHWVGLTRLSYELLCERPQPTYLFSARDLSRCVHEESTEPVLRCRLVNRQHLVYDEYGFVHATFQEYFAALQLSELDDEHWRRSAERAFTSAGRLIVLEFVAGLPGVRGERLQECVAGWLAQPDRFRQVLLRAARLAAAGKWRNSPVVAAIRTGLWRHIVSNDELAPVKDSVSAYVRLDARELCERVRSASGISSWVLNCLVENLPAEVMKAVRLRDLLPGAWQEYAGLELREPISRAKVGALRTALSSPKSSPAELREAVTLVGAARVLESSQELQRLIRNPEVDMALREDALGSLAQLGDRGSVDLLVDVVCGEVPFSTPGLRVAAGALRNTDAGRKALDPPGRDRLLRRMALTPPEAPQWNSKGTRSARVENWWRNASPAGNTPTQWPSKRRAPWRPSWIATSSPRRLHGWSTNRGARCSWGFSMRR